MQDLSHMDCDFSFHPVENLQSILILLSFWSLLFPVLIASRAWSNPSAEESQHSALRHDLLRMGAETCSQQQAPGVILPGRAGPRVRARRRAELVPTDPLSCLV